MSHTNHSTINNKPVYAMISVHGDPTAEIGKEGAGGQNIYVRELSIALAKLGCQIDIFTRREDPHQKEIVELAPGCRVIRLTAGPAEFITRNDLFEYLPNFVQAWLDFQELTGINYTLIHSNYWLSGWVGLQLKSRLGIPQVHTYHSIGAVKYLNVENPPKIASIRHGVEWACLEQADCIIATSPHEADDLRERISPQGRIQVIPCGIDTNHFKNITRKMAREQLKIDQDTRMILYVGRFDARKGIETLITACSRLSQPYKLYLVGGAREQGADWQEQQKIKALVKTLGLEEMTVFMGPVSREQLPAYYAAANVCVVPSYYEPFGLVAIEAMASGTPVIASKVGGLQHTVVHKKTGLLVEPCNPDALAKGIQEVFANPRTWNLYGSIGSTWVESRFSCQAVAQQIHEVYECLTLSSVVKEMMQAKSLTYDLHKFLDKLLKLRSLNPSQIDAVEKLVESFSTGTVASNKY